MARNEGEENQQDRETRDLVLTMLEDYLSAREDGSLTDEQKAVYAACRAEGDTSNMLPTARQTAVKDGDGGVHDLTAAQYYNYQGNYQSIYWNLVRESLPQASNDAERAAMMKLAEDTAGVQAKNNVLIKLGAATTDDYKKYNDLQLYSVPISTYVVAKAKTKGIEELTHKRTGKTITNSQSALIAEAVREMNLDLPETNQKQLLKALGVSDTVRDWSDATLTRKLREFRRDAGISG